MRLPAFLFDLTVFGSVLLAIALDHFFAPLTAGILSLAVIGGLTYVAAQELYASITRRGQWSHESLATALAVTATLFAYYFLRNESDFSLLLLSIGAMLTALMLLVAIIAMFSAAIGHKSARPLAGLIFTLVASLVLGTLAALLLLALTSSLSLPLKLAIPLLAFALWKVRETVRPPADNPDADPALSTQPPSSYGEAVAPPALIVTTQRGLLLDRFVPLLVLGALGFFALRSLSPSASLARPQNTETTIAEPRQP